jgi:hypothetical protein
MNLTGKAIESLVSMTASSSSIPNSVLLSHANFLNARAKLMSKSCENESSVSQTGGTDESLANLLDLIAFIKQVQDAIYCSGQFKDSSMKGNASQMTSSLGKSCEISNSKGLSTFVDSKDFTGEFALGCSTIAVKDGQVMVRFFFFFCYYYFFAYFLGLCATITHW